MPLRNAQKAFLLPQSLQSLLLHKLQIQAQVTFIIIFITVFLVMAELIIFTLHLSLSQPVLQNLKSQYLPRIMPLVILLQCQLDLVLLSFINSIPPMGKNIPLNMWKGWEFSYQVGLH